jgi:hypothetical protein
VAQQPAEPGAPRVIRTCHSAVESGRRPVVVIAAGADFMNLFRPKIFWNFRKGWTTFKTKSIVKKIAFAKTPANN